MKLSVAVLQLFLFILISILTNFPNAEGKSLPRPKPNLQVVIGFAAYQDPARRGTLGKCFFREFANREAVNYYSVKFYMDNELEGEYTIEPNREHFTFTWRELDVYTNRVDRSAVRSNYPEYTFRFWETYEDGQKEVFSCAVQIGRDGPTFYSNQWNTTTLPVIPTKEEVPKWSNQRSNIFDRVLLRH